MFANLYQSAGTVNHNFNTVGGEVEITGEAVLTGGEGIVLNSSAQWIVNRVEATATKTGNVIGLDGNSTERMNRFTVGSGGLTLHHNHTITLAKALNVDAFGNELVLNGSFIANGSVSVKVSNSSGNGVAQINLNGGPRTFQVTNENHTATLNAAVVSTTVTPLGAGATATLGGIIKTGAGTLTLSQANTYGGNTRIEAGDFADIEYGLARGHSKNHRGSRCSF